MEKVKSDLANDLVSFATSKVFSLQERAWIASRILESLTYDIGRRIKEKRFIAMAKMSSFLLRLSKKERLPLDAGVINEMIEDEGLGIIEAVNEGVLEEEEQ